MEGISLTHTFKIDSNIKIGLLMSLVNENIAIIKQNCYITFQACLCMGLAYELNSIIGLYNAVHDLTNIDFTVDMYSRLRSCGLY